ncbi:PAS domain S-box-containing protein [Motilibacter rhizosphaerae]|uniref:Sensor-like histidine kinase SenX3 n=1 Tax=Motilibacter rhizosphaerae TaxID=598652 RepID=A0A4Q7NVM1_9ACTN|nr:ATP-binding protein [Motilibacter rhizosphaerae]RZS91020.1 PAS domain S-box-containing protein [Motilibacter rhizosphaerae]
MRDAPLDDVVRLAAALTGASGLELPGRGELPVHGTLPAEGVERVSVPVSSPEGTGRLWAAAPADALDRAQVALQLEVLARHTEVLLEASRRERAADVLAEVAALANDVRGMSDTLHDALELLCAFVGAPLATAYLREDKALRVVAGVHADQPGLAAFARRTSELVFTPGDGLPGTVLASGRAAWVDDLARGFVPRAGAAVDAGLRAGFAFPVVAGDTVVGVIEFLDAGVRTVDEPLLRLLTQVGVVLGRAVERQRGTEELAHREERLRRLLDSAGDAFLSSDMQGRVTEWNRRAEDLLGWTRAEMIGRDFAGVLVPEEAREGHQRGFARFRDTGVGTMLDRPVEVPVRHRDGHELDVELVLWSTGEGDAREVSAFIRDVGHRHEVERLLRADLRRQEELVEQLRQLDQAKSDVVTTVSHEFRTPLTSMLGYLELLVDDRESLDELHQQALAAVHRNTYRLKRLIDNLVVLSRFEEGTGSSLLVPVDLSGLTGTVAEEHTVSARAKGVAVRLRLQPVPRVPGDRALLERVVDNLLSNAVKFTGEGGSVDVTVRMEGSDVCLSVSDTGVGIPAEEQESVFSRFVRGRYAEAQAVQGSGIGLSVAREVVEAHGGAISLRSALGSGTHVEVRLPVPARSSGGTGGADGGDEEVGP